MTAPSINVDGLTAVRHAAPTSAAELALLLHDAAGEGLSVVPIGGGRAIGVGNRLTRFDLAISMENLSQIVEHRPADLTVTVEAGCRIDALNDYLRGFNQFVALDPYGAPGHTVGGVIAAGWSGPLRLGFGPVRDQVLGLRIALPDGTLLRAGGRTVKNVSGYDLHKLHVGALGSLGVIVEATLKVHFRARGDMTLALEVGGWDACWAAADRLRRLKASPVAVVAERDPAGRFTVLVRYAGPVATVHTMAAQLAWQEVCEDEWGRLARYRSASWGRISVPPSRLFEVVSQIPAGPVIAEPASGLGHWFAADQADEVRLVRQVAEASNGTLVLMAAPAPVKDEVGAWGSLPTTLPLMKRLRDRFDPARAISPGRFPV